MPAGTSGRAEADLSEPIFRLAVTMAAGRSAGIVTEHQVTNRVPDLLLVDWDVSELAARVSSGTLAPLSRGQLRILHALVPVGHATMGDLAAGVGVSARSVAQRVNELEAAGWVKGEGDLISLRRRHRPLVTGCISFEAKLDRWAQALDQACQDRIFARLTYVAFDDQAAPHYERNRDKFNANGIGLIRIDANGSATVLLESTQSESLYDVELSWLGESLLALIAGRANAQSQRQLPGLSGVAPDRTVWLPQEVATELPMDCYAFDGSVAIGSMLCLG
jgi:DNA-binding Lrp family transcriptional regulator